MKKIFSSLIFLLFCLFTFAQETFPVNGPRVAGNTIYCLKNAVLYINPDTRIENGTLLFQDGIILATGTGVKIPAGAVIIDAKGKFIYPSFIDLYSTYGLPEIKRDENRERGPVYESTRKGVYGWNDAIKPENRAAENFQCEEKSAAAFRNAGFGAVLSYTNDGIVRGTSVLTMLGEEPENSSVLNTDAAMHYSFRKGISRQAYPSSLMGAIALLRQTFLDMKWHASLKFHKEENLTLQSLEKWMKLPHIFEANDKYNVLRADRIGDEAGIQFIFKTDGKEYQRIKEIIETKGMFIVPLNFPDPFDVEDPVDALAVSLQDMKHWENAPSNPYRLFSAGAQFAFTSSDIKEKKNFLPNLRKAVNYGLPANEALRALTVTPARMIGAEDQIATLEKGKRANFIITSGDIFLDESVIHENWVNGRQYIVQQEQTVDIRGDYDLNIDNHIYSLSISGDAKKISGKIKIDTAQVPVKISVNQKNISLNFVAKDAFYNGNVGLSGVIHHDSGILTGNAQLPDGSWTKWNAIRKNKITESKKAIRKDSVDAGKTWFPNMAYGWDSLPEPIPVLIKNITVWTNEPEGILKNTDVLIRDGKINKIGKILDVVDKSTWIIDGTGKHLTAGIIDEHSHIAISAGVNEGSHAVTAEVNISDVVNADDINIYRQLSGGVTTSQLLHGSANPIGGRSAIIKLRWGRSPEEMKFENAPGFIKCALGENVKQSNWGESYSVRYPQTRMGVEQIFYDAFYRAGEYEKKWKNYEASFKKGVSSMDPPRRDIQMEVLLDILNSKRFITCHSYVQSEINMLMHVADSMGFTVNTFTHILEGYKVGDKMKEHGVAASTFSDWWAYKYEVIDAIPYNAAILSKLGIITAINSDDAEMARRLNQEAAKAVKYGGLSEEEALKLVTLNPAKMLHLDDKIGSIKTGKDGDLVIWSDHPLSIYAKAEKTFVDGICYFDRDRNKLLLERNNFERARLIAKMIAEKNEGAPARRPVMREKHNYHCDSMEDYQEELSEIFE